MVMVIVTITITIIMNILSSILEYIYMLKDRDLIMRGREMKERKKRFIAYSDSYNISKSKRDIGIQI